MSPRLPDAGTRSLIPGLRLGINFIVGSSLVLGSGCGAAQVADAAPATATEAGRVWPRAAQSSAARSGVLVLAAPPARHLARRAVGGFFEAVRRESVGDLTAWLAEDATISSGPGTTPEAIAKVWSSRFKQLDYGRSRRSFREDAVGVFSAAELALLERGYQLAPAADELLAVVVTREPERATGPRHFGRRLEFLLAPAPDGYRIRRMYEDFQLP